MIVFPNSVLQYVFTVFQELRSEIELEVLGDTEELQMSFTAICPDGTVFPDLKRCSNIKPGETVSFILWIAMFLSFMQAHVVQSNKTDKIIERSTVKQ